MVVVAIVALEMLLALLVNTHIIKLLVTVVSSHHISHIEYFVVLWAGDLAPHVVGRAAPIGAHSACCIPILMRGGPSVLIIILDSIEQSMVLIASLSGWCVGRIPGKAKRVGASTPVAVVTTSDQTLVHQPGAGRARPVAPTREDRARILGNPTHSAGSLLVLRIGCAWD